jgi:hypothetical protein
MADFEDIRLRLDADGTVRWERVTNERSTRNDHAAISERGASTTHSADTVAAPATQPVILRAYDHTRPPSRTPELFRVLPRGEANALLPAEIGPRFSPPLSATSARQKINNARKLEKTVGAGTGNLVRVSWDSYNVEGAGRYYLSPDDYDALHAYLGDL